MKIPCTVDLRIGHNKQIVDGLMAECGVSKDVNQVGTEVFCIQSGVQFSILQFNSSRHLVRITTRGN